MSTTAQITAVVQQIVLRQPRTPRGQQSRNGIPSPLLPVFFAGEENRFAAFVCGTTEQGDDYQDIADPLASMGPLLFVGTSGSGKSALAVHVAARLLDAVARVRKPNPVTADPLAGDPGASDPGAGDTYTGNSDASEFKGDAVAIGPSTPRQNSSASESSPLIFMPGIDFARIYARAVDADDITRFRAELQAAAVLVIDDVHLMIDKPAAQDELAARLEARSSASLPTLLTCRRLPTQVPGLRPLLVSRMLPGLTVPIRFPGPEARRCLVTSLAERRDLHLSSDEIELLCSGLPTEISARQIDAAVRHLELWCRMKATRPSLAAIRGAIATIAPASDISTDQVAKTIARRYKIKLAELKSGTRRQEVVRARSLAMFLARQLTDNSYDKIGKYFGGRDHTTVLHACRKTESLIQSDDELRITANEVADHLKAIA